MKARLVVQMAGIALCLAAPAGQRRRRGNRGGCAELSGPAWSPYLVGALLGVLSWLTFYFSDKPIGASSF